jgi:hypothetical protein
MNIEKKYLFVLAFTIMTLAILSMSLLFSKPLLAQVRKPTVTLAPTQVFPDVTLAPASASLGGLVWHDLCVSGAPSLGCTPTDEGGYGADGLLQIHEPGIGGVSVQLGQGVCPAFRWSRRVTFEPGVYRFSAWSDDGLRFYLDGVLLLNEWHDGDGTTVYTTDVTLAGPHNLVVEYYESRDEALVKFWWKRVADWPSPTSIPPMPTPTPTPGDTDNLLFSEILSAPATVDWDGNGVADERDEWFELVNVGPVTDENPSPAR